MLSDMLPKTRLGFDFAFETNDAVLYNVRHKKDVCLWIGAGQ